jgi:hypothetical protein
LPICSSCPFGIGGTADATHGTGRWAAFSVVTGLVFLVAFAGLASGSSSAAVVLGFWAALLLAWLWLALLSIRAYRGIGRGISA